MGVIVRDAGTSITLTAIANLPFASDAPCGPKIRFVLESKDFSSGQTASKTSVYGLIGKKKPHTLVRIPWRLMIGHSQKNSVNPTVVLNLRYGRVPGVQHSCLSSRNFVGTTASRRSTKTQGRLFFTRRSDPGSSWYRTPKFRGSHRYPNLPCWRITPGVQSSHLP